MGLVGEFREDTRTSAGLGAELYSIYSVALSYKGSSWPQNVLADKPNPNRKHEPYLTDKMHTRFTYGL